jgi:hypothetical protein
MKTLLLATALVALSVISVAAQDLVRFGTPEPQADGSELLKDDSNPDNYLVRNKDGAQFVHLEKEGNVREDTSLPEGCTLAKTRKQSRECRADTRGTGLVYYDVSYAEYYCPAPPTVRRLVVSVKKSVPAARCSEQDYEEEATKNAKLFGEQWADRKDDPEEEKKEASPAQEPDTQTPVKEREAANPTKPEDGRQAEKPVPPPPEPKTEEAKKPATRTPVGKGQSGFLTPQEAEELRKKQQSDPNSEKNRARAIEKIKRRNRDEAGQAPKQAGGADEKKRRVIERIQERNERAEQSNSMRRGAMSANPVAARGGFSPEASNVIATGLSIGLGLGLHRFGRNGHRPHAMGHSPQHRHPTPMSRGSVREMMPQSAMRSRG